MEIRVVQNKSDLKKFVNFPKTCYQNDSLWAPPLWTEERKAFTKKNAMLRDARFALLLAVENEKIIGRNLIYIDEAFNEYYQTKTGFFGAFECLPNPQAAQLLFEEGEKWIKAQGMNRIRGPIHPAAEVWGFIKEGFDLPPVFMSPYNPPYYNEFAESAGFEKVMDLLVLDANRKQGYEMPRRYMDFKAGLLKRKPNLTVRKMNDKGKAMMKDAEEVWRISNEGYARNWGYVPVSREVFLDVFRAIKPIFDADCVWIVEDEGRPVGYCLGFPDLNIILKEVKGKLLPFGFLKLLFGVKKLTDYRLFGLAVLPKYHKMGLDVLLYVSLFEALSKRKIRLEANYILEDNYPIRNALEKMGLKHIKTYRVYEKAI